MPPAEGGGPGGEEQVEEEGEGNGGLGWGSVRGVLEQGKWDGRRDVGLRKEKGGERARTAAMLYARRPGTEQVRAV